ncbi:putative ribosomal protein S11, mitochondrial [Iris pallida]|uniref:Ribosomal protein S11, mitochondrial n=1 Tax=Iris pallida TaxID=29817 RepID=A0AAX6I7Q1_IRIPA|nr:putative ribosomal protein S11, mitochondrial [Iris pallida]
MSIVHRKRTKILSLSYFSQKKNQTFVTVTDARGNKKTGASTCCLGKERVVSSFSACCCSNSRTDRAIRQKDWFEVSCHESYRIYLFHEKEEDELELERRFSR